MRRDTLEADKNETVFQAKHLFAACHSNNRSFNNQFATVLNRFAEFIAKETCFGLSPNNNFHRNTK